MNKPTNRMLAFALALLMLLPLISIPAFASSTTYGQQDFESFTVGQKLATSDGFATVAPFYKVLEENGNNFLRLPIASTQKGSTDKLKVDPTNPSTLLGAMNCTIDYLLRTYPNATLVLVTSWHVSSTSTVDGVWYSRMEYAVNSMKKLYAAKYPGAFEHAETYQLTVREGVVQCRLLYLSVNACKTLKTMVYCLCSLNIQKKENRNETSENSTPDT